MDATSQRQICAGLLLEILPGGAPRFLSATHAKKLLAGVRPRDVVGRTRRRLTAELITELAAIDKKIKAAERELRDLIAATGSTLLELLGIGPSGASRVLGDVGDITRFADRDRFASWNGTGPLDASPGHQQRHAANTCEIMRSNSHLAADHV